MCVHTRHCNYNQCKYGEEDYCPVYLGFQEPENNNTEFSCFTKKPDIKIFERRQAEAEERMGHYDEV